MDVEAFSESLIEQHFFVGALISEIRSSNARITPEDHSERQRRAQVLYPSPSISTHLAQPISYSLGWASSTRSATPPSSWSLTVSNPIPCPNFVQVSVYLP